MSSASISLPPILCLPPEIRLKIYRLLLLSNQTVRMKWLQDDDNYIYHPNCLFPTILSTSQFIYNEAIGVLYGENVFRAHRIDDSNKNAALITRAKYIIGNTDRGYGKDDAMNLERFLYRQPDLKLLVLEFRPYLLEDDKLECILSNALTESGYSSTLRVRSDLQSRTSSENAAQLMGVVDAMALIRNHHPEHFKKIRDGFKKKFQEPSERNRELKSEGK